MPKTKPWPLERFLEADVARVETVLCDIDDTLTRDNRLEAAAFAALWKLHEAGYRLVPVTGRPAGWCDAIIRQWPVDAVIGENGAFTYYLENGVRREFYYPEVGDPQTTRGELNRIAERVYREVPGTRAAKDQPFRLFDLAVDFREEPPFLDFEAAERIRAIFVAEGAVAKTSSIHVNAWIGEYDKLSMTRYTLRTLWDIDISDESVLRTVVFCGDSPNDEPMFAAFPNSCGVANIRDMLSLFKNPPSYICRSSNGAGFAELAELLLASRSKE